MNLDFAVYFGTPIYSTVNDKWLRRTESYFYKNKEFKELIIKTSSTILENMGYDIKSNTISIEKPNENNQLIFLYFLKTELDKLPIKFKDTRKNKINLKIIDETLNTFAAKNVIYNAVSGSLFFIPSYVEWDLNKNKKTKYIHLGITCKNE